LGTLFFESASGKQLELEKVLFATNQGWAFNGTNRTRTDERIDAKWLVFAFDLDNASLTKKKGMLRSMNSAFTGKDVTRVGVLLKTGTYIHRITSGEELTAGGITRGDNFTNVDTNAELEERAKNLIVGHGLT
jgi:hypothetical protein